jgi:hypothetical protein
VKYPDLLDSLVILALFCGSTRLACKYVFYNLMKMIGEHGTPNYTPGHGALTSI